MSKKKELAKGYTCKCGRFHKYPMYVYAHWRETLIANCTTDASGEGCGRRYRILAGEATLINEKAKVSR